MTLLYCTVGVIRYNKPNRPCLRRRFVQSTLCESAFFRSTLFSKQNWILRTSRAYFPPGEKVAMVWPIEIPKRFGNHFTSSHISIQPALLHQELEGGGGRGGGRECDIYYGVRQTERLESGLGFGLIIPVLWIRIRIRSVFSNFVDTDS